MVSNGQNSRGDVYQVKHDQTRNHNYYNSFDTTASQRFDDELKRKRNAFRVFYGAQVYREVTRQVLKMIDPVTKTLTIDKDADFNRLFGDPKKNIEKYLIIQQQQRLTTYPEHDHGIIQITVP